MSYGTRKAIAGGITASEFASEGVPLFIQKMNDARSAEDIKAALDWAKHRGGWFHRTSDDDKRMRAAYEGAVAQITGGHK